MARPAPLTLLAVALLASAALPGCAGGAQEGVLRLGYFPNLTHAQALFADATGLYERHLNETRLETMVFNAGPSAFEALFAGEVDVVYVGPSPTITALDRKGLDVVVIVAGASSGGASFVARDGIDGPEDLPGRKLATPQLGNTQDVALKHYLLDQGLKRRDQGGDVEVINAQNPDIFTLFQNGDIDGAWVPEPWATRLVVEAGANLVFHEQDLWPEGRFVTTHLVTTRHFVETRGDDVRALLAAHTEATAALQHGTPEVLRAVNDGIERATGKRIPEATLEAAFPRIEFLDDPLPETFQRQYEMANDLGFVGDVPDVRRAYDLSLLPQPA